MSKNLELNTLKVIGSVEWCAFDQLGIPAISARVDSGAKTSSIQATEINLFKKEDEDWVEFTVRPLRRNVTDKVKCRCKVEGKRAVKGSFGISEDRLIIKTPVTIGDNTFDIELTLANRNTMEYKMLLGREAISNRFLIDTGKKNIQKKIKKKEIAELYNSTN